MLPAAVIGPTTLQPESRPTVLVRDLRVAFRDREVLASLDLALTAGTRTAVHGPNGAGKTTLLRCIAGTLEPTGGRVEVHGRRATSVEARAQVGAVISSERSFALRLSALENLRFFARLRHRQRRAADRAVDDLVGELELSSFIDQRADRCSSGMLQQLAFARSLLAEPAVLVLDEPTRSMDADARARLWGALDRRPEKTLLIATHDSLEVERCAARIALRAT